MAAKRTKECAICSNDRELSRFPLERRTGAHTHGRNVCDSCWRIHLEIEIRDKHPDQICCCQCSDVLQPEVIGMLASKRDHTRSVFTVLHARCPRANGRQQLGRELRQSGP